ncbi:hypothetical protein [Paenibacillus sp. UMB4589-SE434]|uniref:hypothetical protein n=1 Tax=Paenibacillus sp. UMB4589-SE434 TaxID=3046314 RepID=UPI00254F46E7|nr:hypothetical protein [Paenibacillus sp. UMB4589-SE434]MDK8181710.1 hypothetical protein [Paenibacillus sp. UMB4589-SE434]
MYKAIEQRTTNANREQYLKKIAHFYKYKSVKSIKNAYDSQAPIPLHAEDILNLENHFGIDRDEILGGINKQGLSNVRSFQRLYGYMKRDEIMHQRLAVIINELTQLMLRESAKPRIKSDMQPEEKACQAIKLYIQGL